MKSRSNPSLTPESACKITKKEEKDLNEEKLILMNKLCGVFRTPRLPASPAPHLCLRYGGEQMEAIIARPFYACAERRAQLCSVLQWITKDKINAS